METLGKLEKNKAILKIFIQNCQNFAKNLKR